MIRPGLSLARNEKGASALEFAIVSPLLFALLIGIVQLAILYFANAGLSNAVGEGARMATIYPQPTTAQIRAKMADQRFGLDTRYLETPVITSGEAQGAAFLEITAKYAVPLDFIFYKTPPITLEQKRRVYVHRNTP